MARCATVVVVEVVDGRGERGDVARGVGDIGRPPPSVGEYGGGESLPGDL